MNQDSSVAAGSRDGVGDTASATLWTIEREVTTTSHRAIDGRPVPIAAPIRWLLGGLAAVGGLVGLAGMTERRIESALVDETEASLIEAGLDPASFEIDFDFRNGRVAGSLPEGWTDARFQTEITVDGAHRLVFEPRRSPTAQETDS